YRVWLSDENGNRLKELEMATPGSFSFVVPKGESYDVKAFRDANSDGWPNNGDPWAHHANEPIEVNATRNDFNVPLVDRDSDEDGWLDLHEEQIGTDPYDANSKPGLDYGLVAYYPFDGNASDMSGNGHDGTVNGATLATDRHGGSERAYSFDGVNDWIESTIGQHDTITFTSWVRVDVFNKYYPKIVAFGSVHPVFQVGFLGNTPGYVSQGLVGVISSTSSIGNGGHASTVQSPKQNPGEWFHVTSILGINE
ncbi:uncharacterized protein METZ01_LOCUS457570, partial [marine metagenome]